jgi:hypothetical protein
MSAKLKFIFAAIAISFGSTPLALAENCRALPFGPDRKACAMREHPAQFQAKQKRCERIALDRGFAGRHSGKRGFMRGCMRGKATVVSDYWSNPPDWSSWG